VNAQCMRLSVSVLMLIILWPIVACAQLGTPPYNLGLDVKADPATVKEGGFLFWKKPQTVDFVINWDLRDAGNQQIMTGVVFRTFCSHNQNFAGDAEQKEQDVFSKNQHRFENMKAYTQYYLKVEARNAVTNELLTESQRAAFYYPTAGAQAQDSGSARYSVIKLTKQSFQGGSILGKIDIVLIFAVVFVSLLFWYRCWRTFRNVRLSPTDPEMNDAVKYAELCDVIFDKTKSYSPEVRKSFDGLKKYITREWLYGKYGGLIKFIMFWEKGMPVRTLEKEFKELATVRILKAGVDAAVATPIPDPDKVRAAMEARAEVQIEELKKRSYMEWLWNLGFIEPLLGLFGTVTGLGNAFFKYGIYGAGDVQKFAPGVAEALATTIWGLLFGVPLMMLYYYYSYKMERVVSMWGAMCVRFTEDLRK
jgi:biopolymer transport protein ExbB/TolQ